MKRAKTRAVVEKIEDMRKPDNFFGLPQTGASAITRSRSYIIKIDHYFIARADTSRANPFLAGDG